MSNILDIMSIYIDFFFMAKPGSIRVVKKIFCGISVETDKNAGMKLCRQIFDEIADRNQR